MREDMFYGCAAFDEYSAIFLPLQGLFLLCMESVKFWQADSTYDGEIM